ncbi:MAG: adenylate/guanylate cyclase domain-containing protein [Myxococcota bacterium]
MKVTATRGFIALALFAAALLAMRLLAVQSTIETTVGVDPVQLTEASLREQARRAGCGDGVELWLAVLDRSPDDLEALRAIAACARRGAGGELVDEASELLEKSRFLRTLPQLLDELDLKDSIPIVNRVHTGEALGSADLTDLGRLQHELGDVQGAVASLREAVTLDPTNGTAHMLLAHDLVASGDLEGARISFRRALASDGAPLGVSTLYAAGLAWPGTTGLLILGIAGLYAVQAFRWPLAWAGDHEPVARAGIIGVVLVLLPVLTARFQLSGDPVAFFQLLVGVVAILGWTLVFPLRGPVSAGLKRAAELSGTVLSGRFDTLLEDLPITAKLGLLLTGVVLLVAFAPAVDDVDVAAALAVVALLLIFSTVGSILLVLLRQSASMRSSLWWLGFAGTLPFLGFFLYIERRTLIQPLRGQSIDADGIERIVGILIVWGIGALAAAHLSRILSRSILDPVEHVLNALAEVQRGNLDIDATSARRDEIGQLGLAVNGMADGIREHQRLSRTFRRYMDDRIWNHLLEGDVERGQLVDAVVMFSDLRGFTSLSETLEPEALVDVLNRYFGRIAPLVAKHGGVVDKYMGDGMLAVWGVPEPRPVEGFEGWSDEELAADAALEMVEAVRALSEELGVGELRIGIGLHRGPLVAGPMGSEDHREYTVVGDTVNTAQRIESQARDAFQVLVSGEVARRIERRFELVAQEPVVVKGKAEALALFGLVASATR